MAVSTEYPSVAAMAGDLDRDMPTWLLAVASACGIWFFFILVVQAIGTTQL